MSFPEVYAENYADSVLIGQDEDEVIHGQNTDVGFTGTDLRWSVERAYVAGWEQAMRVAREGLR